MSLDQHKTFGLRKEWLLHLSLNLSDPGNALQALGTHQRASFSRWFQQAGLGKMQLVKFELDGFSPSEFFQTICQFDPNWDKMGTWATLLFNLCRKEEGAENVSWFANHFFSSPYSKRDLIQSARSDFHSMSPRTIDNGISALIPFLNIPNVGKNLCLAIPEGDHFLRQPYTSTPFPLPVFAYALFLQGQTYQRDSFSTMEVEEGEGFPRRIFGLGRRQNEELLDALHSTYNRKLIEVSRTGGLNVVYLKSFTPNQMAKLYYLENKGIEPMQALKQLEKGEE